MTASGGTVGSGGKLGNRGVEQKGKGTHGYGQQYGNCWREGGIRGLNGTGKKYNKVMYFLK